MGVYLTYDIFSGKEAAPLWLESSDNREGAYKRMLEIALEKPDTYFVFCTATNRVIYAVDTTPMLRLAKSEA
jgi:hypothetical protein